MTSVGDPWASIEPPRPSDGPFVEWSSFWDRDRQEAEWLLDQVLARGRGHAFYAAQKTGKSLVLLWAAVRLATGLEPVVVIYLDYEMGEDDVFERLTDMGYGPHSDLSRLCYALLPRLSPLDTQAGADELLGIVDDVQRSWPDHHIAVVIDTASRAVAGDENSADTIRAFYRHTGIRLKQRGVTWARLDHSGKDTTKGQRGSSAKGDDVDVIWQIERTDDGVVLKCDAARMGWVPPRVPLVRRDDPLRYEVAAAAWPPGTHELASLLDRLGVPADAGNRQARAALVQAEKGATNSVLQAAVKYRKNASARGSARGEPPDSARGSARGEPPAETKGGTPLGTLRHASESNGGTFRISRCGTPQDHDQAASVLSATFNAMSVEEEIT